MIKLVVNELTKIFKRKITYVLFFCLFIFICIFNYLNPNDILNFVFPLETIDISKDEVAEIDKISEKEKYIELKTNLDLVNIYKNFSKDSWQAHALEQEDYRSYSFGNDLNSVVFGFYLNTLMQLKLYLYKINSYENYGDYPVSSEEYNSTKELLNKYISLLEKDDFNDFIKFQLDYLYQLKYITSDKNKLNDICDYIMFTQIRLDNNIYYSNDILNEYIIEARHFTDNSPQNTYEELISKAKFSYALYALKNNINYDISPSEYNILIYNKVDARNSLMNIFNNFNFLIVLVIVFMSISFTEEFQSGTVKSLLTNNSSRAKVLMSKFIANFILILITFLLICFFQFIVGGIFFGFDSYSIPAIVYNYNTSRIDVLNIFLYLLLVFLTKIPMYIINMLIFNIIGLLVNKPTIAISFSLFIYFVLNYAIEKLFYNSKYLIFNNWDFSIFLFGKNLLFASTNLYLSVSIFLLSTILFWYLSILLLKNKDIKTYTIN